MSIYILVGDIWQQLMFGLNRAEYQIYITEYRAFFGGEQFK